VSGALFVLSLICALINVASNLDFLKQKSGTIWSIVRFLFFTSTGTVIFVVIFACLFVFLLLFELHDEEDQSPQNLLVTEAAAEPAPVSTVEDSSPTGRDEKPQVDFIQGRIVDVWLEEETGELRDPMYENDDPLKAIVAEFRRLPDAAGLGFIDIRASLTFCRATGEKTTVNDACWRSGEGAQYFSFEIGDCGQLIIALFVEDKGGTYERRVVDGNVMVDSGELPNDVYDVDVELIGTKANKLLIHENFELKLQLRPKLSLARRGLHAEVRVVRSEKPPRRFTSLSDLNIKADESAAPSELPPAPDESQ
jgi:hypothetical protein